MAVNESPYVRSYNSFSGTDIRGVFGSMVIAELQAISYSITREKGPIYTMGSPNPRAFARGKRGIAGTLIFIMFDSPALMNAVQRAGIKFYADTDELVPGADTLAQTTELDGILDFGELNLKTATGDNVQNALPQVGLAGRENASEMLTSAGKAVSGKYHIPWYADQIPPIDITLTAANEYGAIAVMKIWGIEILNEGYGVSIDDIVSEEQMTWVGRDITKWVVVEYPNPGELYGGGRGTKNPFD